MDDTLQLHHPALDVRLPRDVDQEFFKYTKSSKHSLFQKFEIFKIPKIQNIQIFEKLKISTRYVCLEMQKFLASLQFQWDRELYDAERDQVGLSFVFVLCFFCICICISPQEQEIQFQISIFPASAVPHI